MYLEHVFAMSQGLVAFQLCLLSRVRLPWHSSITPTSAMSPIAKIFGTDVASSAATIIFPVSLLISTPTFSKLRVLVSGALPKVKEKKVMTGRAGKINQCITKIEMIRFWDFPNASRFFLESILSLVLNSRWRCMLQKQLNSACFQIHTHTYNNHS